MQNEFDLFIIGGGINGMGIAADAAGRGLSVCLCEKNDLASGTSSASTKLIHGGLRYLELYDFKLVRKALAERENLLHAAPFLVSPLQFILPYEKHLRPAWLIRLGLFIYDHLAPHPDIPKSHGLKLNGSILKSEFIKAFSYYDCATDDARLVILNALRARENGATILPHTEFISASRENTSWKITIRNTAGVDQLIQAKALINTAGAWLEEVNQKINANVQVKTQLVKGSHIVVPQLYKGNFAFILQHNDKRIVFAIPYQQQFTLIGTTDVTVSSPEDRTISAAEKNYLCEIINFYFNHQISSTDIVWSYAGIRCLQYETATQAADITRDDKVLLDTKNNLPLITLIGGKLTTYRVLAEEILDRLKVFFPQMKKPWTATTKLPGAQFTEINFGHFYQHLQSQYRWLPAEILTRYAHSYGSRALIILRDAKSLDDLDIDFGAGLYSAEVDYLVKEEWAMTLEDILWRRTKLGLHINKIKLSELQNYLKGTTELRTE